MDTRIIYEASETMKLKANWDKFGESEWIHFGTGSKVNIELVNKSIDQFFVDNILYLATTRKESIEISKNDIKESIISLLGKSDFFIWDAQFQKVIEFNKIGVYRQGHTIFEKQK